MNDSDFGAELTTSVRRRLQDTNARLSELRAAPVNQTVAEEVVNLGTINQRLSQRLRALECNDRDERTLPHDVADLVSRSLVGLQQECERRDIALAATIPTRMPEVTVHAEPIIEALRSVIDNAVAAVGDGGRIAIRAERVDGDVEIHIGNNGPTMSAAARLALTNSSAMDAARVEGLGLLIVRHVIARAGGRAQVSSSTGWTEVTLRIPRVHRAATRLARNEPRYVWVFPTPTAA